MKKILILGGASVHCKLVNAAKNLGYYTIVTDYLNDSPAKRIADESWMINVMDIDLIVEKCREEGIDGVICGWLDPCQRPYVQICNKLGLPCYATEEQVFNMTDKHAFKRMCIENGVSVIPEFTYNDIEKDIIDYPVFVKPVDSRGSRGQTICFSKVDLMNSYEIAQKESSNGDVIIEKYIGDKNSFQVTYFFVNGEAFIIRTADGYKGTVQDKLDKVALCSISPSIHTNKYLEYCHTKVVNMLKKMGIKNGPAMLQGFYDNDDFMFYDPGLRFPGVDYDLIYKKLYGIDVMELMSVFAVEGKMPEIIINNTNVFLDGKSAAVLFPTVSSGTILKIEGVKEIQNDPEIISLSWRYKIGDSVGWTYNVSQRIAEIDFYSDTYDALREKIKQLQKDIIVRDIDNRNMIYCPFDTQRMLVKE